MQEITIIPNSSVTDYQERITERGVTIEALIQAWLHAKEQLSHSAKTQLAYARTIQAFRSFLQSHNLDLIFKSPDFIHLVGDAAQSFVVYRSQLSHHKGAVASATQGQRLSILSSFYAYAIKRGHLSTTNPILLVDRPTIEAYGQSRAIEHDELAERLKEIDLSTERGLRDMAILLVLLHTGRRVSEVASLTRKDVTIAGTQVMLTFKVKGGGTMRDILEITPSSILTMWLTCFYGEDFIQVSEESPLWVDLHHKELRGCQLKYNGFSGICNRYLGTTKVHVTRHSFAVLMEEANAKLTDIQRRLGHKNVATTGIYMEKMTQDENAFSGEITKLLGFK
jgi:integrase/recombinase XerD